MEVWLLFVPSMPHERLFHINNITCLQDILSFYDTEFDSYAADITKLKYKVAFIPGTCFTILATYQAQRYPQTTLNI